MTPGQWTFLSNHAHVLVHIARNPDARIADIARAVGITERATQGIVADLEQAGYLEIERVGRRNTYRVNRKGRFRHPAESGQAVGALLDVFRDVDEDLVRATPPPASPATRPR